MEVNHNEIFKYNGTLVIKRYLSYYKNKMLMDGNGFITNGNEKIKVNFVKTENNLFVISLEKNIELEFNEYNSLINESILNRNENESEIFMPKQQQFGNITTYNGITFRSKLEAQHAFFMDQIKVKYVYERYTINIDFGGGAYTPDFLIIPDHIFVEIKPYYPSIEEQLRCKKISEYGTRTIILFGQLITNNQPQLHNIVKGIGWDNGVRINGDFFWSFSDGRYKLEVVDDTNVRNILSKDIIDKFILSKNYNFDTQ